MIGDGSQLRSWCYIDDFCDAMMGCIENEKAIGQDFNVGNPVTAVTIYDLAARTIRLAKSSSKISTTAHTFSDIGVRAPSSVKARELLGLRAEIRPRRWLAADDRMVSSDTWTTSATGCDRDHDLQGTCRTLRRRNHRRESNWRQLGKRQLQLAMLVNLRGLCRTRNTD